MKAFGLIFILLSLSTFLNAQDDKLALVIGNSSYEIPLMNPVNDANDVSRKLKSLGFDVELLTNASKREMRSSISRLMDRASEYDAVLLYYAGHGLQVKGENFLVPVDAMLEHESDAEFECESLNHVLANLSEADCKMKIVILDACRNNPFERKWYRSTVSKGLSAVGDYKGTIIHYATAPGRVASDGIGRNSPYTSAFLETLDEPNLSLFDFFNEVANKVLLSTNERQEPTISAGALQGSFYFNGKEHQYLSNESGTLTENFEKIKNTASRGYINGHEFVDLGLSVKWATCNVGSDRPEQPGDYFAWGEVNPKAEFLLENSETIDKDMSDISGNVKYDAATVRWKSTWRIPTKAEFQELIDNCMWEWYIYAGSEGFKVTSKINGSFIFLPSNSLIGSYIIRRGDYWTSTPALGTELFPNDYAYFMAFNYLNVFITNYSRSRGKCIRPVSE